MSVVAIVLLAASFCAASLLVADRRSISLGVGLVGLLVVAVAASYLEPAPVSVAGLVVVGGPFLRLILVAGSWSGLALSVVGLASGWVGQLPAAMLATLAALAVALSAADPLIGVAAAAGAGLPGIAVALRGPGRGDGYMAGATYARAVVVGLALATGAAALVGRTVGSIDAPGLAAAYVALSLAVAIRLGAVPFHLPAARLARSGPAIALPILLAWAPAGLAAVALAWTDQLVSPLALPLGAERTLVVVVATATLVVGAVGAWVADQVDRAAGYLTIQAGGYLVLGMAVLDPAAWQPVRAWLLVFLLVATGLAAWAVAVRAAFDTARIEALDGWARRAPLLGLALLAIALALVGWPGSWSLDARVAITRLSVGEPAGTLLVLVGLAPIATFGRLAVRGLSQPGPAVAAGSDERIRRPTLPETWPAGWAERGLLARSAVLDAWRLDRGVVSATLVLLLALGSVVAAGGGLGLSAAASAPAPTVGTPTDVGPASGRVGP